MKNNYIHPKMNLLNLIIGGIFMLIAWVMFIFNGCKKHIQQETPCTIDGGYAPSEIDKWIVPGNIYVSSLLYNNETNQLLDTTSFSLHITKQTDLDRLRTETSDCIILTDAQISNGDVIHKLKVCPIYGCFIPD